MCGRLLRLHLNQNAYSVEKCYNSSYLPDVKRCFFFFWFLCCALKCFSSNSWEMMLGINLINCTKYCFLPRYLLSHLKYLWHVSLACSCCLFHLEIPKQGNERWHVTNCVGYVQFWKKKVVIWLVAEDCVWMEDVKLLACNSGRPSYSHLDLEMKILWVT